MTVSATVAVIAMTAYLATGLVLAVVTAPETGAPPPWYVDALGFALVVLFWLPIAAVVSARYYWTAGR